MTSLSSILLVVLCSPLAAYGAILLKKASSTLQLKTFYKNKNLILGILFYGIATLMYFIALMNGQLSVLYPLISLTYVWTVLFSEKFLNERMNKLKWLGIILILLGVSLIGIGS